MHFKISKSAQNFFGDIMNLGGSHAAWDKTKFMKFDVYYCCALVGMAAAQIDTETSDLEDMVEHYPNAYAEYREHIAGLLVASEAIRKGIGSQSPRIEEIMLEYLSNDDTLLSEEGIKALNAYALKGYHLLREFPLVDKPTSREQFLEAVNTAVAKYMKETQN